jgi:ATP-dependent protease HslVU (ClpYQ) peptidase subunit
MTTIAYKDGIIAYDGRVTAGSAITYDDYDKCVEREGVRFVLSGFVCDYHRLIDAYFGEELTNIGAGALVVDAEGVWNIGHNDGEGVWKSPVIQDKPYAIGSGSDHAYTAMDMGASAYQAVEMAMKRDSCTGGKIRTLTVKVES